MPTVECKNCEARTAVDLKLDFHAPSTLKVSELQQAAFLMTNWTAAEKRPPGFKRFELA